MTERTPRHEITMKQVVYQIPGDDAVKIRRDVHYRTTDAGVLTMDLYYPPEIARLPASPARRGMKASRSMEQEGEHFPLRPVESQRASGTGGRAEHATSDTRIPAVVVVLGYSDVGTEARLGCKFKEAEFCTGWARLMAASGLVAITYTNREPAADLQALLQHVRQNAASLGVDENRIGVWASSGNVPLALSVLMQDERDFLKCAVLCYGFTLDLDGSTAVAEAAGQWRFVNPGAGKSAADLPQALPLFVARAGQDEFPHLNETLDRFVAHALTCNLPVTVVNHRTGPHAFDLHDDSETSREIIRQILGFMQFHLLS